jgi:hypothetical protein
VEVILDERAFDNDVSIETFFSNCVVSYDPIGTVIKHQSSELLFLGIKRFIEGKT